MVQRDVHSHLAFNALLNWGDGLTSCLNAVRQCRAGQRDGLDIPMNNKIANLGGPDFENVQKQFKAEVLEKGGAYSRITPVEGSHFKDVILPSTTFRLLGENPRKFRQHMAPSSAACTQFWRNLFSTQEGLEFKRLHPHLKDKSLADLAHTVPFRVHEDAGPFTKLKSMAQTWST